MKKIAFGLTAATLLGLASFSSPASAFQAPMTGASMAFSDVTIVQFRHRLPGCTVRTVVSRGPHGRRVVKRVRICR
jgi:hypothetical protein